MTEHPTPPTGRTQNRNGRPRPFALYVRVSDRGERADDKFRSPEFQREAIARFASSEGIELRDYPDEIDVSGSRVKRPTLDEVVRSIEAGELAGLVVARLNRFSRLPPTERLALIQRIEAAGGRILSATESNDLTTPEGRMVRELFYLLARMEWEQKAEGFAVAKRNAISNGVAVKSRAPFGYKLDKRNRHVVDERLRPIVVRLFELRAAGASYGDVAAYFEEATGGRTNRTRMSALLANRTYLGELRHGELVKLDAHEPIIEPELFERVQAVTAERRPDHNWSGKRQTLLAGIAECASCGRGLTRSRSQGRTTVYRCPSTTRECKARATIREAELDAYVLEQLLEWAGPVADEVVEVKVELALPDDERAALKRRLVDARRLLREWAEDVERQLADELAYEAGLTARAQLVAKLENEEAELGVETEVELARATLREVLTPGADVLEVDELRRLLGVVLKAVRVRKTPRRFAPTSERAELVFVTPPHSIIENTTELSQ